MTYRDDASALRETNDALARELRVYRSLGETFAVAAHDEARRTRAILASFRFSFVWLVLGVVAAIAMVQQEGAHDDPAIVLFASLVAMLGDVALRTHTAIRRLRRRQLQIGFATTELGQALALHAGSVRLVPAQLVETIHALEGDRERSEATVQGSAWRVHLITRSRDVGLVLLAVALGLLYRGARAPNTTWFLCGLLGAIAMIPLVALVATAADKASGEREMQLEAHALLVRRLALRNAELASVAGGDESVDAAIARAPEERARIASNSFDAFDALDARPADSEEILAEETSRRRT